MTKHPRPRSRQRGFILVSMYMVLAVLLILGGALVTQVLAEMRFAQRSQSSLQAFYLAEAAVDQGTQWLRSQPAPPGGTQALVLNGGWQTFGAAEGRFMVVVDPDDNNPTAFIKRYTIQGWGSAGNPAAPVSARQTNMAVQVESFARYAYATNSEISSTGSTVWFITGDRIRGPAHTNGQFSVRGNPIFDGLVSSVSSSVNLYNPPPAGGNNPVFNGGQQLGAAARPFPTSMPAILVNAAQAGGNVFTGNTTVTLLSGGTMRVTNAAQGLNGQVMPLPPNGVLYVQGGNVTLSGTLSGQLTVASGGDVRIPQSITYANNPRTNPNSQDILGIVAAGNVAVASTAPNDLEIDASIMALNTSFAVENWSQGPPKGTLTLYGGLIQKNRGPVGTFSSSTGTRLSGYAKDYYYDARMANLSPPFFPTTGSYSSTGWEDVGN